MLPLLKHRQLSRTEHTKTELSADFKLEEVKSSSENSHRAERKFGLILQKDDNGDDNNYSRYCYYNKLNVIRIITVKSC